MTRDTLFDHISGRRLSCGDATLYVEEKGDRNFPALILLHGGFGDMEDFNCIAPALAKRFRLIGVDSRGHGKSSLGSTTLSYALLAEDLAQAIDAMDLDAFSILGFSDGGIAAFRYAARRDPRLQKIVAVGSSWEMDESEPAWGLLSGMTGEIWKSMFPESHERYMRLNPAPDFERFAAAVVAMWTDLTPNGHPGALMDRINAAMLVVRGDKDPLTSLESMAKLHSRVSDMHFLNIPFAEHVAFQEASTLFLHAVGDFFDSDSVAPSR